ncbi:MAG: conjugative transposon protein TraM [Prevotella sp.]|nr:conjugative transposon protein TraM [Prevotella sp.]
MKIDFRKIDLRQGKYWFPLVLFVPLVAIAYFSCEMFKGTEAQEGMVTDSINTMMPEPAGDGLHNKFAAMEDNILRGDGYTAIGALSDEGNGESDDENVYSESEMDRIDQEKAAKKREEEQMAALQQQLRESRMHINQYDDRYTSHSSGSNGSQQREMEQFEQEMRQIQERSRKMARDITGDDGGYGSNGNGQSQQYPNAGGQITGYDIYGNPIYASQQQKKDTIAVVTKAEDSNGDSFNTITDEEKLDDPLIKAMIDKTTKAHEGTRLRFKLLDDVIVKGTKLKKGTYLYGTVTGFGQQRVMADITSILVKDKFMKIHLTVYDLDGMQGFYVPESAFRDMMKNAGSAAMQSNISFDSGGSGGISAEALALQALQNVYQSTSSAVSQAIRKNRAKIKYNSIVYLINEQ